MEIPVAVIVVSDEAQGMIPATVRSPSAVSGAVTTRNYCRTILALVLVIGQWCAAGCSRPPAKPKSETEQTAVGSLPPDLLSSLQGEASEANHTGTHFRFREIGSESGFSFLRYDDMRGQRRIAEVNGGGVGLLDFDRDGWLDVFMSNGCRLPLAEDSGATPGKLFRNRKALTFSDCSQSSRLMQFGFCCGCAVADFDNDGFEDLYLTAIGGNQFWSNNGDGTFTEVARQNGTHSGVWGASAAFADLNGDQCLDLYVANYLDISDTHPKLCPEPRSPDGYVGCTPVMFNGVPDNVFLSDGSGAFTDISSTSGQTPFAGKSLGVVICDLTGDYRPEIYVANDGQPNFLLTVEMPESPVNSPKGIRLNDIAVAANAALNYEGVAQASMGIAARDFDRNGLQDIFLTHFYRDTNTLYLNRTTDGTLLFEDATRSSRLGLPSHHQLGFGVAGLDADNNGWKDLLIANGHVDDRTWFDKEQHYRMTPQLFENRSDGSFREVSAEAGEYFRKATLGRAVATGDLDRDQRLDVVISNQRDPSVILHNETPSAEGAMILHLIGKSVSRTPVGVQVRVSEVSPVLTEQLVGGGSYQAADANELHLAGLKENRNYDLELRWPDGSNQSVRNVGVGYWVIRQHASAWKIEY